ncbi:hypothetical protein HZS_7534 [Henneguya salminicola]|nr:hypothetical protein HZS_7534 [Henneguya salminicola]
MLERLKTISGFNMLKPEYNSISNPQEIELNNISSSQENIVVDMFLTSKLAQDNLELILFMSSSHNIPYWSVALKFDSSNNFNNL